MSLTSDDLQQMKEEAEAWVAEVAVRVIEDMHEPEIQRAELSQYLEMQPGDHAKLFAQVGEKDYGEYAAAMEKLRRRAGG